MAYKRGAHEVGDGVWAYLQPDGGWGWSNAGLVSDGIADFSTLDITATSTIALDSARSIGTLKFGDATTANNDPRMGAPL